VPTDILIVFMVFAGTQLWSRLGPWAKTVSDTRSTRYSDLDVDRAADG